MTNNKNENAYYFIRLVKTNLLVVLYVEKIYSGNKTGRALSGVQNASSRDELTLRNL